MAAESPPTTSTNSKVGISLGVKDFNVDSYAARLVDAEISQSIVVIGCDHL